MMSDKPIGWVALHKSDRTPVKTNSYPCRTSKLYTSLRIAKAAIKNSVYRNQFEEIEFIPVFYPR